MAEIHWKLGEDLVDARYANCCMDEIRRLAETCHYPRRKFIHSWPMSTFDKAETHFDEDHGPEESHLLKKLIANTLAFNNPCFPGDDDVTLNQKDQEFSRLLVKWPNLNMAIHKVSALKWTGSAPWEDEHRNSYMMPVVAPLVEEWKQQILNARTMQEVPKAAKSRPRKLQDKLDAENLTTIAGLEKEKEKEKEKAKKLFDGRCKT